MPKTCVLNFKYTIEIDENRWGAIIVDEGPRLNFNPESVRRLQVFLSQKADYRAISLSETYIASVEDEWLMITAYHRDDYSFSPETVERLKQFLDESLGPLDVNKKE